MSKEKIILIGAEGFRALLEKADDSTDFKVLFLRAIGELDCIEQRIIVFTENQKVLQSQLEDANELVTTLRGDINDLNEQITNLEAEVDGLRTNTGSGSSVLQQQLDEAYDTIAELGRKLDLQERTKKQQGILVEFDGKPKLLIGNRFQIKGVKYDAEGVAKSPEALAHLYNTGSHSLVDPVSDDNPIV